MKTLIFAMVTGVILAAFAVMANAGTDVHSSSIDSSGYAVVSIHSPSSPLPLASSDSIYLDSNKIWAVNSFHSFTFTPLNMTAEKTPAENMYCFDSMSRFCARSY